MTISAVLIVKNEGRSLRACLGSVASVVDEIVVVDTGSNDDTLAIARQFASRVAEFPWQDDFAAARNFAIGSAQGDWLLQIDADETIIAPDGARALLDAFVSLHGDEVVGTVEIESVIGADLNTRTSVLKAHRFFRHGRYRYSGAVHEQLVPLRGEKRAAPTGIRFAHAGYSHDVLTSSEKSERNARLLLKELAARPNDGYCLYRLGKTYFCMERYAEAAVEFERALACVRFGADGLPTGTGGEPVAEDVVLDLLTSLAYALVNTRQPEAALALLEKHRAIGHPATRRPDFQHAAGYVRLMLGDVSAAEKEYLASLEAGPAGEQVRGTGSFASLYHLGLLREAQRDLPHSLAYYLAALRLKHDHAPTLSRCVDVIHEYGVLLPPEIWAACDQEAFASRYVRRILESRQQGCASVVQMLLQAAEALSPELQERCVSTLAGEGEQSP